MKFQVFEAKEPIYPRPFRTSKDVYECVKDYSRADKEMLIVMPINGKGMIIDCFIVHLGTADTSVVAPRDVFRCAIEAGAVQVVVAHNHPSGDCAPSCADDLVTENLMKAGEIIGIKLLDHVIIGKDCFYSYSDNERIGEVSLADLFKGKG